MSNIEGEEDIALRGGIWPHSVFWTFFLKKKKLKGVESLKARKRKGKGGGREYPVH